MKIASVRQSQSTTKFRRLLTMSSTWDVVLSKVYFCNIYSSEKRWQTHPSHDSKFTFFIINLRRYTENVWNTISVPLCLYLVDSILLQRQVPLWVMVFNFRWSKKVIVKDKADSEPICSNRVFGDPAQHNCVAKYNEAICYSWRDGFR